MPKTKPQLLLPRPLSWSGMLLLETDEKRWVKKYLLGEDVSFSNSGLRFGKEVADYLETGESENFEVAIGMPTVKRYEVSEMALSCVLSTEYGEIPLLGQIDTADRSLEAFREYKTGRIPWNQAKAQKHGQMHFYATMIYTLKRKIPTAHLDWLQTEEVAETESDIDYMGEPYLYQKKTVHFTGQVKEFEVKLTLLDILKMRSRIIKATRRIDVLTRESLKDL